MTEQAVQSLAKRFLRKHDITVPTDLKKILKMLNADLVYIEIEKPRCVSGVLIQVGDCRDNFVIGINALNSEYHRRFALAHEIAHIILNHFETGMVLHADMDNFLLSPYPMEREANIFAAELLIPTGHFKSIVYESGLRNVEQLCRMYQVCEPAMQIKMREIGVTA